MNIGTQELDYKLETVNNYPEQRVRKNNQRSLRGSEATQKTV